MTTFGRAMCVMVIVLAGTLAFLAIAAKLAKGASVTVPVTWGFIV